MMLDECGGYKTYTLKEERTCPQCNKKYKRYHGEKEWIVSHSNKKTILCSYCCWRKFLRAVGQGPIDIEEILNSSCLSNDDVDKAIKNYAKNKRKQKSLKKNINVK